MYVYIVGGKMKILLIPSAVLMPREMRGAFGNLPTALFPLGRKPMLYHLYEKYKNHVDKMIVVGYERVDKIVTYIEASHLPIDLLKLDNLSSLGHTIDFGLQEILKKYSDVEYIYINFADCLVNDDLLGISNDFVFYAKQEMDEQWTWFQNSNGYISEIMDKKCEKPMDNNLFQKLFIGTFGIKNPIIFSKLFQKVNVYNDVDPFYQVLQMYSYEHKLEFKEANSWFDVGHNENYVKAQSSVAARSFNSIIIDDSRGTLRKTSTNKEKLINEIRWYLRMPNRLQYLLPRIYDYSLDFDEPFVTMEYYGYHTLHESLLYGDSSVARWKNIFKKLLFAIEDMQSYRIVNRSEEIKEAMKSMYVDKTIMRLDKMRSVPSFVDFFDKNIVINNRVYLSLNQIIDELPSLVERILLRSAEQYFSIIHGDLCFTNILVEDNYNFMRFIDPRGKFGNFDIYGDSRYELAKLFHTLEGHYDYIIEDMFSLNVHGNELTYKVKDNDTDVWSVFCEVFRGYLSDMVAIRLIEATLFLSMIPLHSDSLTRQYAMLATGVKLFDQVHREVC